MARFEIKASIGLDGRGFQAGLMQAERSLQRFASQIGSRLAGIFSAGAFLQYGRMILDWAGEMQDFADVTGMSAEQVQTLNAAMKQNGLTLGDVTTALKTLSAAREQALGDLPGTGKLGIFETLGFTQAAVLQMRDSYRTLTSVGNAVARLPAGMQRTRIATELFGKSGGKAIAALGTDFDALRDTLTKAGALLSHDELQKIDTYGDRITALGDEFKAAGAKITIDFIKPWERFTSWVNTSPVGLTKGTVSEVIQNILPMQRALQAGVKMYDAWQGIGIGGKGSLRGSGAAGGLLSALGIGLGIFANTIGDAIAETTVEKTKKEKILGFAPPSDELARIGGFVGGTGRAITVQQQQLSELKNIRRNTERLADSTVGGW